MLLYKLSEVLRENSILTPPDFGRLKVVRSYWQRLTRLGIAVELGAVEKIGTSSRGIEDFKVFGDFKGKHVHMFDDIVVSAKTLLGAVRAVLDHGAEDVSVWITHAVLPSTRTMEQRLETCQRLVASPISKFYFTDSLPLGRHEREIFGDRLEIISISQLLALVIMRLHEPRSGHRLSSLFELDGYRRGLSELTTT
jgi:ribose-phosphate pyrophosphokinase